MTFALDGKPVLTKKKPPVQRRARPRRPAAPAQAHRRRLRRRGTQVAGDEMLINSAANRFQVRLAEPQRGKHYESSLLARAEVDGARRPDRSSASSSTSTRPWSPRSTSRPISSRSCCPRARRSPTCARWPTCPTATRPRTWSSSTRRTTWRRSTSTSSSSTPRARPQPASRSRDLEQKDFTVCEDGVKQEIARFERVTDLPIHAAVTIDISASMEPNLDKARDAALQFLQQTIQPKDRAAVVTFNDHPNLAVKFTNDVPALAGGLAGLKAERGTRSTTASSSPSTTSTGSRGSGPCCCSPTARTRGAASPTRTPWSTPAAPA